MHLIHTKLYPVNKIARLTKLLDAKIIIIWGSQSERLLAEEIKTLNPTVVSYGSIIYRSINITSWSG